MPKSSEIQHVSVNAADLGPPTLRERILSGGHSSDVVPAPVLRRIRTLNMGTIGAAVVSLLVGIRYLIEGLYTFSSLLFVFFALCVGVITFLRFRPQPNVGSHAMVLGLYSLFGVLAYISGGIQAVPASMICTVPVVAGYLLGHRALWTYVALAVLMLSGLYSLDFMGVDVPNLMGESGRASQAIVNRMAAVIALSVATYAFLGDREPMLKGLVALSESAHRLAYGDYKTPIRRRGVAEVAELSAILEQARQQLEYAVRMRKAEEEHLQLLVSQAESAGKVKSGFLATMSHELRTPINAVVGYSELLIEELEDDPDTVADLRKILGASRDLLELIDNVLTLAEELVPSTHISGVECESLLQALQEDFARLAKKKGCTIRVECAPDLVVRTDQRCVRRCMLKLVKNACTFTGPGEIVLAAEPLSTGGVSFSVHDSGPGVPEELRDEIFEPFVQAESGFTRVADGAGLGLAVVRRLCESIGATVGVEDGPGGGALFRIEVPKLALID